MIGTDDLAPFFGVYKGFSPSDDSRVKVGEMHVSLDKRRLCTSMATGTQLKRAFVTVGALERMSQENIRARLASYDVDPTDFTGFTYKYRSGPEFLFRKSFQLLQPDLLRFGAFSDFFGPTELYGPTPWRQRMLNVRSFPQCLYAAFVPRICYNGLSKTDFAQR